MYIKNQRFQDEETLAEFIFDFELGDPYPFMDKYLRQLDSFLQADEKLKEQLSSLSGEDKEVYIDTLRMDNILAFLMNSFDSFEVKAGELMGIRAGEVEKHWSMPDRV